MKNYKGLFTFDADNHKYVSVEQADGIISDMNYRPEPEEPKGSALDIMILTLTNFIENEPDEDKVDLEDCKQMSEKLKAWKRLKDKGFRFDGWEDLQAEMSIDDLMLFNRDVIDTDNVIGFRMDDYHDCIKDLSTCFGGKE